MKFLTVSKMKDTASTVPPSVMRPLLEASLEVMKQEKKEGKVLEYYFIPGWDRVLAINEIGSADEILKRLSALPIGVFLDFEVYPLGDAFEAMRTYIESLKIAEKMFPGPPK
jgi:muconolactone delta-isomerase